MADLVKVSSGYEAALKEISDLRERPNGVDKTFSYRPSRFLNPDTDKELLHMFPTVRWYNELSAAMVDLLAAAAHFVLHLELLQLYGRAMGASDTEDSAEQRSFAQQAILRAHVAASRDCDAIIEIFQQFFRPRGGILLGAGKVAFPMAMAAGYLAKTQDPRLQYILTVEERYQAESGFPSADLLRNAIGLQ